MNTDLRSALSERADAIAGVAKAWRSPDHPPRAAAVRETLRAPNRFTEEALAFAVNAAMHRLTPSALMSWWGRRSLPEKRAVGVQAARAGAPLTGLRPVLAAMMAGHAVAFCPSKASPALVTRFGEAVAQEIASAGFAAAGDAAGMVEGAEAVVAGGSGEERADFEAYAAGLPPERRHWVSSAFSVAVVDGTEGEDVREGLAEDVLLYEGYGASSVRLVWAPAGTAPDPYLEAMAHFRAVFPAHPDTEGALQLQKAFLDARGQSHAHGEGLEFLLSRGDPEVQPPGHVRWAEYETLDAVNAWLAKRASAVHAVADATGQVAIPSPPSRAAAPGTTHRAPLQTPETRAILDFVAGL